MKPIRYQDAGVNIEAGEEAVRRIKGLARSTFGPQVLTELGRFGGFFRLDLASFQEPVLVSSIDGVGTKLKVAFAMNRHDTVGQDLVNHCINDILVGGARPLFFLDYIGTGHLDPGMVEEILKGMATACREAGCALIGGEMAEMPGFYAPGEYDLVGCIVGIVEKSKIITGETIRPADVLIGLPSNGLHTNGYSLARKVLFEIAGLDLHTKPEGLEKTLGEELLRTHRSYLGVIGPLLETQTILGMSHITGGGIVGNTVRILPPGCSLQIDWEAWERPPIFNLIQTLGQVPEEEMRKAFNLGIGLVLIVRPEEVHPLLSRLSQVGEKAFVIGRVISQS